MLDVPIRVILSGAGAMAPPHEALRRAGRHPRELILLLYGGCAPRERDVLRAALDDLVVTDDVNRCLCIVRVSDLIRQVTTRPSLWADRRVPG